MSVGSLAALCILKDHCFPKQGLTITCSKRGGDASIASHSKWLQTVPRVPDAIMFKFVPITSLLTGIPGSGYLSHAINLYLRCKFYKFPFLFHKLQMLVCHSIIASSGLTALLTFITFILNRTAIWIKFESL